MSQDKYQMDMCHGPLLKKIVLFTLPLIGSYILQLTFNAVDLIIIGRYTDHQSLAAIGNTINFNALVINLLVGCSVGGNVLAANRMGARDTEGMSKAVHTSIAIGLWGGIAIMIIGLAISEPMLSRMGTPDEILPKSCTYIRICFLGLPCIMLYNFGCAILRAVGDTRRPFYYLIVAGIVNVLLNLFFVIVCKMNVEGVAIATVVSHIVSAVLVIWAVCKLPEEYRLTLRKFKIDFYSFKEIIRIGAPAGISSSCFSVSNIVVQSAINSFGAIAMAAAAAAVALEGLIYVGALALHQAATTFVAQNLGGNQYKRILRSVLWCYLCVVIVNLVTGFIFFWQGRFMVGLFNPDPDVIREGVLRLKILTMTYFLCGLMDVSSGALRGLGYSVIPAFFSLGGACVFRILWVIYILPLHRTMEILLISYPFSWILVGASLMIFFFIVYRRLIRTKCRKTVLWSKNGPGVPRGYRTLGGSR